MHIIWMIESLGYLWVVLQLLIAACYLSVYLASERMLAGKSRRAGRFIGSCGVGHLLMAYFMAVNPALSVFIIVLLWDMVTTVCSALYAFEVHKHFIKANRDVG